MAAARRHGAVARGEGCSRGWARCCGSLSVTTSLRVLVTGGQGQVGNALLANAPAAFAVRGVGHAELDIGRQDDVSSLIADFRPGLVINAAAFTAVDRAEAEPEAAAHINVEGAANL